MSRQELEAKQVSIYFGAVLLGLIAAWLAPGTRRLSVAIEPLLALMLFATFLQVPLAQLRGALRDLRFVRVLLLANFVAVPLLVAALLPWVPDDPVIRLGVLLVLLAPCIDYVVTFAHLGRADARALLAATPLLLAVQMLLLPLYLGVFLGPQARQWMAWEPFLRAFVTLIVLPFLLAAGCQAWGRRGHVGARVVHGLGILPVPATAAVLAVVVAAMTPEISQAWGAVRAVAPLYIAFALAAPMLGWMLARSLPLAQRRAVAFSTATRNSLVVLPMGLAIPGALPVLPAVILTQTLIELAAELIYVKVATTLAPPR
ncbi:arsenic resistance protein [Bordetella genomosp. 12]|nr:arsenic resistance protein [Bordetella genomosp. 12]